MTTANLSAIIKAGAASPTTLLAAFNTSALSLSYTATVGVRVSVIVYGISGTSIVIGGATFTLNNTGSTPLVLNFYLGQGQTLIISSSGNLNGIISVEKGA